MDWIFLSQLRRDPGDSAGPAQADVENAQEQKVEHILRRYHSVLIRKCAATRKHDAPPQLLGRVGRKMVDLIFLSQLRADPCETQRGLHKQM